MVFLHPNFLWGLLAVLIPIIIHLFDFRKNKKVYFPDISFLKQVQHSSKKPLKLKQLLILISRILFIVFLVLAFAQPILKTEATKKLNSGGKLIYIDNSPSMSSLTSSSELALTKAKLIATKIVENLPAGQEVVVVDNYSFGSHLIPLSAKESLTRITEIAPSENLFSLTQLKLSISNLAKQSTEVSDVFIISDFQKSTLAKYDADSSKSFWLSPLELGVSENCVVDSIYLLTEGLTAGESRSIEVIVKNFGGQVKENLGIKVFLGDRQVSAASITIPAFQTAKLSFPLGTVSQSKSGYVQIEDYPNTFDNVFYFSLPVSKKINVLEINGDNASPFIKPVFGNSDLFDFNSNNFQNIDNNLFERANLIILNQIDNPSMELTQQVNIFIRNGGAVLVIPSPIISISDYKNFSARLKVSSLRKKQQLKLPSANAPFFKDIFEKMSGNFKMPNATPVLDWGQDRSAILSFEDGSPFLSELKRNLYFLRSPIVDSLSNFQTHALFVPVMYKLASNLRTPANQLFYRVNQSEMIVDLDSAQLKDVVKLVKGDLEIIPTKIKEGNNWRLILPADLISTGTYQVYVGAELLGSVAVNLTKEESDLNALNSEGIKDLFSPAEVNFLDTYNSNQNILISFDGGITLWKYALVICLLFLLMESLLIRFL